MLIQVLQGENLDSDFGWLDPVTAALERQSLSEGVAVEESRRLCDVMGCLVRIRSPI